MTEKPKEKREFLKMNKGWHWLLYLDLILPLFLFLIAFIIPSSGIKESFSVLFHTYNIYIIKIIPNFGSLTGITGILIHLFAIVYAVIKKNYKDLIICVIFTIIIFFYFFFEVNYIIIKVLKFTAAG